jgi:hypothetical protein
VKSARRDDLLDRFVIVSQKNSATASGFFGLSHGNAGDLLPLAGRE